MHDIKAIGAVLVVLLVIHLAGGLTRHAQHRRKHGFAPRISYTFGRGWWASVRVPVIGGRYGRHI
jgi:hypothetical protein